jgi:photosystem II stability/assembly factor-like uncharacterized protein
MKKIILLFLSFNCYISVNLIAQQQWQVVSTAPSFSTTDSLVFTDVNFIDDSLGWAVTNLGDLFKTENGGDTWNFKSKFTLSKPYPGYIGFTVSSISFLNKDTGFAMMRFDTTYYKTTDGGLTWKSAMLKNWISFSTRSLQRFKNKVAILYWQYPAISYIFTYDHTSKTEKLDTLSFGGAAVGYYRISDTSILFVADTCVTGQSVCTQNRYLFNENLSTWSKAQPPINGGFYLENLMMVNEELGFAHFSTGSRSLIKKTSDGCNSFNEILKPDTLKARDIQQLFFLTPYRGWIGSDTGIYETKDGGISWQFLNVGHKITGFTKKPNGVVYGVGKNIIRLDAKVISSIEEKNKDSRNDIVSIFPNPSNGKFTIRINSKETESTKMEVFDILGNKVEERILLDETNYLSIKNNGVYIVKIWSGSSVQEEKIVVAK